MTDVVLTEIADRVATVTLNRPAARNALSSEVLALLPATLARLDGDDDVDVIVLTGSDPAFCAGLDLRELGDGSLTGRRSDGTEVDVLVTRGPFPTLGKPLIGAINGAAITGGLELALNCDFLVASERARFGDTHARVGVMPGWGLTVLLPEAIGVRRAREMSFTGNFLEADEALRLGLVNHVVAHDELLPFTRRLALDIVAAHQPGVREIRRIYASVTAQDEAWKLEAEASETWRRRSFSREHVAQARSGLIERGSRQQATPGETNPG